MRALFLVPFLIFTSVAQAQTGDVVPPASNAPSGTPPDSVTPANRLILQDGARMMTDGDYDGAISKLNTLILADPKVIDGYILRGEAYTQKKMWDKATADFQSARQIDPQNVVVSFDLADMKFIQKSYDEARAGFAELAKNQSALVGQFSSFKVFLCDLMGNHPDLAKKEFDDFNNVGSGPSYYYANATWAVVNHHLDDARGWLASAGRIYSQQKNSFYIRTMMDLGFLPLPPSANP